MLIDGRLVSTTESDDVINPATGKPFASCARATSAHVAEAVAAAARSYRDWRKDEGLRRQKLRECAGVLQSNATDIAQLLSQEQGKPIMAATVEVFGAAVWFSYFADLKLKPETLQDDSEKRIQIV